MAYVRYKEVTRTFNFSKYLSFKEIPSYGRDYVYEGEVIYACYVVGKDIALITNKKIVLFDNTIGFGMKKEITTIPYQGILSHSIVFFQDKAEIYCLLSSSNPLVLKFSDLDDVDKMRLRYLYNAMSANICGLETPKNIEKKLVENDFEFEE